MLRSYQNTVVEKMLWSLTIEGNSVVSLPTGSGKSHVIAEFVNRVGKPVLVFTPSKELLEQDYEKLCAVIDPNDIGIFSASKGIKEVKKITIATIQSAYKHPELFNHYTIVICDEAHSINPKQLDGMYNKFFKAIGSPKIIGLTATAFRMDSFYRKTGKHWQPWETVTTTKVIVRYQNRFWKQIIANINTQQLIDAGYLCPLVYEDHSFYYHEQLATNKSASDFDLEAFEELIGDKEPFMAQHIVESSRKHESVLVFCTSISQAERLSKAITGSYIVSSETKSRDRDQIITGFKHGTIKVVFNVNCLTTGFDHPALDAIYLIRPTRSVGLLCQMLGRGTRLFTGKKHCTVYDFSGNIKSIGTLESIKLMKVNNLWNVTSDKYPQGLHLEPLYTFAPKAKKDPIIDWMNT